MRRSEVIEAFRKGKTIKAISGLRYIIDKDCIWYRHFKKHRINKLQINIQRPTHWIDQGYIYFIYTKHNQYHFDCIQTPEGYKAILNIRLPVEQTIKLLHEWEYIDSHWWVFLNEEDPTPKQFELFIRSLSNFLDLGIPVYYFPAVCCTGDLLSLIEVNLQSLSVEQSILIDKPISKAIALLFGNNIPFDQIAEAINTGIDEQTAREIVAV